MRGKSDTGAALATLTPGKLTLSNQIQDLASLNTDLSKANDTVKPFDIDKLKAQQQSAAALSQLANIAIGDIATHFNLPDGGVEKTALHAAAGALTALVAGGNVGTGALAGAGQELIGAIVDKALMDNPNLTQDERNALGRWAATLVGAMAGGMQGAATALDAETFNRQLHIKEADLIRANAARYAVEQGYCQSVDNCSANAIARAQSELTMKALRRVDSEFADINASQTAGSFLDELARENSAPAGQSLFSATPDQFANHVLNIEYLSQNKDLYDTFGKSGESRYYTAYVAALVSAANDTADLKNATPAQASAVLNGLKDAIGVVEKGQANATGLESAATGSEQTYLQLLDSLTNAISTTAGTNGAALQQFAIQNAALVNGLMANAAFAQSAGKLIQVEYMIAVGGAAAVPVAQELAAMCSLGAQACAAQANVIFQEIVASIPELGGTGVGLAGITAIDKEAVEQALTKAAKTGAAGDIIDASGHSLIAFENFGGHTIADHVGKTDADLLARLASDPNLNMASAFPDIPTASRAIADTISANESKITSWIAGSANKLEIDSTSALDVGSVMSRGASQSITTNKTTVVLIKDPLSKNGYTVLTSFPDL